MSSGSTALGNVSILVDAFSPLISLGGTGWTDAYAPGRSSIFTDVINDTMSYTFNGTGTSIYGIRAPTHGQFEITVDNGPAQRFDSYANTFLGDETFFINHGLQFGQHMVTVRNLGNSSNRTQTRWECNNVTFDLGIPVANGASDRSVKELRYETSSKDNFTLSPSSDSWTIQTYTDSTIDGLAYVLRTTTDAASLMLNFTMPPGNSSGGGAVGMYGAVTPNSGTVYATLRNLTSSETVKTSTFSAQNGVGTVHGILMFFADGLLPNANYSFNAALSSQNSSQELLVEAITTWTTGDVTTRMSGYQAPQPSVPPKKSSHAGAIAGGVVGGIVGLLLIGFLVFLALRQRRRARDASSQAAPQSWVKPDLTESQRIPEASAPHSPTHPPQAHSLPASDGSQYGAASQALNPSSGPYYSRLGSSFDGSSDQRGALAMSGAQNSLHALGGGSAPFQNHHSIAPFPPGGSRQTDESMSQISHGLASGPPAYSAISGTLPSSSDRPARVLLIHSDRMDEKEAPSA